MTKAEKAKMREALDEEFTFCFKKDDWTAAMTLLNYTVRVGLVSREEYRWLRDSMDCLSFGR